MQKNGIECCNYEYILSLFEIPVEYYDIDESREYLRIRESIEKYIKLKDVPRYGRNAACPCGSGMKYKMCCGRGLW